MIDYKPFVKTSPNLGTSIMSQEANRSSDTWTGFADAAIELLGKLGITKVVVFGWSLGGHIGIEIAARFPGIQGLTISGTTPK